MALAEIEAREVEVRPRDPKSWYPRLKAVYELHHKRPLAKKGEALTWFIKATGVRRRQADSWAYGRSAVPAWAWLLLEAYEYMNQLRIAGQGPEAMLWRLQRLRVVLHGELGSLLDALKTAEDELVTHVGYSPKAEVSKQQCRRRDLPTSFPVPVLSSATPEEEDRAP
jgi:hypothetical protein